MSKLAYAMTILPICLGMAAAQDATPAATTQSSGAGQQTQSFYGVLMDSKCSTTGAMNQSGSNSGYMARTTASSTDQGAGMQGTPAMGREMGSKSPAGTGRDWNTTDHNTSGTADRAGTSNTMGSSAGRTAETGAAANSDMNSSAAGRDHARDTMGSSPSSTATGSSNMNRTTTDMNRPITSGSADRTGSNTGAMDRTDTTTGGMHGSAHGTDTQAGNNNGWTTGEIASNQSGNSGKWDRSCFISTSSSSFVLQLQDGRTVHLDNESNSMVSDRLKSSNRVADANKIFRVSVTGTLSGDTLHITDIRM